MRAERMSYLGIAVLALLCFLAFAPVRVSAGLVWSESFDEINDEYWSCVACQIIDGALRPVQGPANTQLDRAAMRAYRVSNVSEGTWRFDLKETAEWDEELDLLKVYYIAQIPAGVSEFDALNLVVFDYYALSLVHISNDLGVGYSYTLEKYFDGRRISIANYIGETKSSVKGMLQHFTITRQIDGLMSVYLNSSLILQTTDTDLTNTSFFGFYTWDDWAFDNVSVYNTLEIGGGITTLLVGLAIGVPVAIVAIAIIRRR